MYPTYGLLPPAASVPDIVKKSEFVPGEAGHVPDPINTLFIYKYPVNPP